MPVGVPTPDAGRVARGHRPASWRRRSCWAHGSVAACPAAALGAGAARRGADGGQRRALHLVGNRRDRARRHGACATATASASPHGAALFAATVMRVLLLAGDGQAGRSASLVGLGLLFLAGGWMLGARSAAGSCSRRREPDEHSYEERDSLSRLIHLAMVGSLGAKLLTDRAVRPRVVGPDGAGRSRLTASRPLRASTHRRDRRGISRTTRSSSGSGWRWTANRSGWRRGWQGFGPARVTHRDGHAVAILEQPLAYFIPEHVPDPSVRHSGEELWVEVTLPMPARPGRSVSA